MKLFKTTLILSGIIAFVGLSSFTASANGKMLSASAPTTDWVEISAPVNTDWMVSAPTTSTNWVSEDGKWKYLNQSELGYSTGWEQISDAWYYFNSEGYMTTGFQQDGGTDWYYLDSTGKMMTGWVFVDAWYYFDSLGRMRTDSLFENNMLYHFASDGKCINPLGEVIPSQLTTAVNNNDRIMNSSWIFTDDGTYLNLFNQTNFLLAPNKAESSVNYYTGSYEFFVGNAAAQYLTVNLSAYGVTNELIQLLFAQGTYTIDDLVCIAFHKEKSLVSQDSAYLFGLMSKDGRVLYLLDLQTREEHTLVRE